MAPVSPLPLNMLTPLAAAAANTASMLWTSANVCWSSQSDHELLMTVTPSLIMAFKICCQLVFVGAVYTT